MTAWQVCPHCGAITYLWTSAAERLGLRMGDLIRASMLAHPDGRPCVPYEAIRCPECGSTDRALLDTPHLRTDPPRQGAAR